MFMAHKITARRWRGIMLPEIGSAMNSPTPSNASKLPFRLAAAMTGCTLFLVLFGGSVTTMGAGMAVKGWINAEGHFMPLFPIAKWFRDSATFVEHTHRLIGTLVGLLSIATLIATHRTGQGTLARRMTWVALVAICVQGAVGGFRVLENNQDLAFLHGALGQLVLATLWCTTLVLMPSFQAPLGVDADKARSLFKMARVGTLVVYGQVFIGTWFRHAVRVSTEVEGSDDWVFPVAKFLLHGMGAMCVLLVILVVAKGARNLWSASDDPIAIRVFRRLERWLVTAFIIQLALGAGALMTLKVERTDFSVVFTSTMHVLFGALTLAACASAAFWGLRLSGERA